MAALVAACTALGCDRGCATGAHEDPRAASVAAAIPRERAGYVSNNGSDSLSVLDLDRPGTTMGVSLDFDGRREAPHHLAIDPVGNRLYLAFAHPRATSPESHREHGRSAIAPGELVSLELSTLRLLRRREVDENPGDLVLTADAAKLLVTHYDLARAFSGAAKGRPPRELFATLQVWDAHAGTKWAERAICVAPHGIAVHEHTAFVACYGSDELVLVDVSTPELRTERFPLGVSTAPLGAPRFGPYAVTLSPDGRDAIVSELEGKELRVFDRHARRFDDARTLPLGARALLPCFSGDALYVPLAAPDGLARVRGSALDRVAFDAWCITPHAAACRADGRVFVVCEGERARPGAVVEIDPATLAIRARWSVGIAPDALVFGQ